MAEAAAHLIVNLLALWIWISALATLAGWALSALCQLNRVGYAVFAILTTALLVIWRRQLGLIRPANRGSQLSSSSDQSDASDPSDSRRPISLSLSLHKLTLRFRRPLPICFAILALLVFIGGALYAPSNHTALSYRIPRVLHWLAEGKWHWIHTTNYRMNDRACGIEWLSAPLLLFFQTDRILFLLNFIPYLFLPGLLFGILRSAGVCGRVAWQWMWIFPTGYNFLLQAGTAGNDTFPTIYALAAIHFAFRAYQSRRVSDLWLFVLSAALLTGAKASNLPLLLPWAVVGLGLLPLIRQNVSGTFVIALVSLTVSFVPTALLNIHYCGDWSGLKMENAGMNMKNPVVGIWGNIFIFLLDNFLPPFFPPAGSWNQHALAWLPHWLVVPMQANFESGWHILGELPTEDWIGIGFGVSLLAAISLAASVYYKRKGQGRRCQPASPQIPALTNRLFLITPWIALLAYCMKSGMVTGPRLISPYYPLLLPSLLVLSGQSILVRKRWWKVLLWLMLLLAFPVLILTPGRPLWPAQTILTKLHASHPQSRAITRALEVYRVYSIRPDPLANVRALLPAKLTRIGFMGAEDDIEVSIWRPFGSRVLKDILVTDSADDIRGSGIDYVVVGGFNLKLRKTTIEDWLNQTGAQIIAQTTATVKVSEGEQPWYVVRLR